MPDLPCEPQAEPIPAVDPADTKLAWTRSAEDEAKGLGLGAVMVIGPVPNPFKPGRMPRRLRGEYRCWSCLWTQPNKCPPSSVRIHCRKLFTALWLRFRWIGLNGNKDAVGCSMRKSYTVESARHEREVFRALTVALDRWVDREIGGKSFV